MNGWLEVVTLVSLAGLIPLGIALPNPFHRPVPVLVRAGDGARRDSGAGR